MGDDDLVGGADDLAAYFGMDTPEGQFQHALAREIERLRETHRQASQHLVEAQRWTMSGGECSIHIEAAQDVLTDQEKK